MSVLAGGLFPGRYWRLCFPQLHVAAAALLPSSMVSAVLSVCGFSDGIFPLLSSSGFLMSLISTCIFLRDRIPLCRWRNYPRRLVPSLLHPPHVLLSPFVVPAVFVVSSCRIDLPVCRFPVDIFLAYWFSDGFSFGLFRFSRWIVPLMVA